VPSLKEKLRRLLITEDAVAQFIIRDGPGPDGARGHNFSAPERCMRRSDLSRECETRGQSQPVPQVSRLATIRKFASSDP